MSIRAVGLAPSIRRAAFTPQFARNQVALRSAIGKQSVQTQLLPPSAPQDILNKQCLQRPFTIYQPQLTWLGSITHRVTGASLSAFLYGFSLAYLVAPRTFDSAHVIELVAGKVVLAAPFAFHGLNGVRHLAWDLGLMHNGNDPDKCIALG